MVKITSNEWNFNLKLIYKFREFLPPPLPRLAIYIIFGSSAVIAMLKVFTPKYVRIQYSGYCFETRERNCCL